MTVTAAYIFLAIALAPALIEGGLNPIAVHLFILYWGMLSFITPPVALGAFAAASISGSKSVETDLSAMVGRCDLLYSFFFVLEPSLVLQGEWVQGMTTFRSVDRYLVNCWRCASLFAVHRG